MAMNDEEGVKALVDNLMKVNPTEAPASSDLLPGTWELLWSSPGSDYSRLRGKLDGSVLPVCPAPLVPLMMMRMRMRIMRMRMRIR